jgi:hypothetical protein
MRTRSGLIELQSGWTLGVASLGHGLIRLLLQFDPKHEVPSAGVKELRLTVDECDELERALAEVRARAVRVSSEGAM